MTREEVLVGPIEILERLLKGVRRHVLEELGLALESGHLIDPADYAGMAASRTVIQTLLERDVVDQSATTHYAPELQPPALCPDRSGIDMTWPSSHQRYWLKFLDAQCHEFEEEMLLHAYLVFCVRFRRRVIKSPMVLPSGSVSTTTLIVSGRLPLSCDSFRGGIGISVDQRNQLAKGSNFSRENCCQCDFACPTLWGR